MRPPTDYDNNDTDNRRQQPRAIAGGCARPENRSAAA